jgi:hypothetical protein
MLFHDAPVFCLCNLPQDLSVLKEHMVVDRYEPRLPSPAYWWQSIFNYLYFWLFLVQYKCHPEVSEPSKWPGLPFASSFLFIDHIKYVIMALKANVGPHLRSRRHRAIWFDADFHSFLTLCKIVHQLWNYRLNPISCFSPAFDTWWEAVGYMLWMVAERAPGVPLCFTCSHLTSARFHYVQLLELLERQATCRSGF